MVCMRACRRTCERLCAVSGSLLWRIITRNAACSYAIQIDHTIKLIFRQSESIVLKVREFALIMTLNLIYNPKVYNIVSILTRRGWTLVGDARAV